VKLASTLKHALGITSVDEEGEVAYNSTRKAMIFHDGIRLNYSSNIGYMPLAYPMGLGHSVGYAQNIVLAANGGTLAVPIILQGHILLQAVSLWTLDTSSTRGPIELAIYEDRRNDSNSVDLVPGAVGTLAAYTASAAAIRTIPLTSPPVYLPPGLYWVCIKNNHASNALTTGARAGGTMGLRTLKTKTLSASAFGSTLDLVAATWTANSGMSSAVMRGRILGQSVEY
jgi:hypothetical protein